MDTTMFDEEIESDLTEISDVLTNASTCFDVWREMQDGPVKVIHENADIGFVAPQDPRRLAQNRARRIHSRDESLRRRLFIARRSVDLSGEEEPGYFSGFERRRQLRRIHGDAAFGAPERYVHKRGFPGH